MLVIGIAKGRGFLESLNLFKPVFSHFSPEFLSGRLPYIELIPGELAFVQARSPDLPWLLSKKHVQAVICNSIWFSEHCYPNNEFILSLNINPCRLSLIVPEDKIEMPIKKICTRFHVISTRSLQYLYPSTEIIKFNGSEEASLILGFADAIVDIIETGWTIKKLKLAEKFVIQRLDHTLWINKEYKKSLLLLQEIMPLLEKSNQGSFEIEKEAGNLL